MPLPTLQPLVLVPEHLAAVVWQAELPPAFRSLSDMSLVTLPPPMLLLLLLPPPPLLEPASAAPALAGVCQDSMTDGVAVPKCHIFVVNEYINNVTPQCQGSEHGLWRLQQHTYGSRHGTRRVAAGIVRHMQRGKDV